MGFSPRLEPDHPPGRGGVFPRLPSENATEGPWLSPGPGGSWGIRTKHARVSPRRGGNRWTHRQDAPNVLLWLRRVGKKGDERSHFGSSDNVLRIREIGRSRGPIGGANEADL